MIFEIPIDITTATADGEITFDVELDGPTYTLQLSFCEQSQLWYMNVFLLTNTTSTPIALGVALVVNVPLLINNQLADRPAGELILVGTVDPARTDLGSTCVLRYYDAAEIAAAEAAR